MTDQSAISFSTVCYVHPERETVLRCNRCERPICTQCATRTPTGYRCKECIRGQQKVFETAQTRDYVAAAITAGIFSFIGSIIASAMGFFTLFIGPIVGVIIAETIRALAHRRRSRLLAQIAAGAAGLGSLPFVFIQLAGLLLAGFSAAGLGGILSVVYQGLFTFLVISTVYYRLTGIQL